MNTWRSGSALAFAVLLLAAPSARAAEGDEEGRELKWFGSLRVRPEYNDNLSDALTSRDDKIAYTSYRANVGTSVDLDQDVTVLLDVQALGVWGEAQTPQTGFQGFSTEDTNVIFHRAYIEARKMFGTDFSLRAGRQPLVFGDEWLLGDSDFYGGTSWDGLRGTFGTTPGTIDVFWATAAETDDPETVDFAEEDVTGDWDLYGIWTTWPIGKVQGLDVAALYSFDHRSTAAFPFQDKRFTAHVRYHFGAEHGLFFNGNAGWQGGETLDLLTLTNDVDISATAGEATVGFVWDRGGNPYRVWGRLASYSGDKASTPDKDETFRPLAQDSHARYGITDFWTGQWGFTPYIGGPAGFQCVQLGFDSTLPNTIRLRLIAQQGWRDERRPETDNKNLGQDYSLSVFYNYGKNLELELGVGQTYPGAALNFEEPGVPGIPRSTARRAYLNVVARF